MQFHRPTHQGIPLGSFSDGSETVSSSTSLVFSNRSNFLTLRGPVVGSGDFRLNNSPTQGTTTCAFTSATKKGVAPARYL